MNLLKGVIFTLREALGRLRGDYYVVNTVEPVVEVIDPGASWVAIGKHGRTLVTRNMAIWDVDDVVAPLGSLPIEPNDQQSLNAALALALQKPSDDKLLMVLRQRLEAWATKVDQRFAVYRTFNGARVICISHTVSEDVSLENLNALNALSWGWFAAVGECLKADTHYMRLCDKQKSCRARLEPKSRNSSARTMQPDDGSGERRTCRFIGFVGGSEVHPALRKQLRHHDDATGATGQPLDLY